MSCKDHSGKCPIPVPSSQLAVGSIGGPKYVGSIFCPLRLWSQEVSQDCQIGLPAVLADPGETGLAPTATCPTPGETSGDCKSSPGSSWGQPNPVKAVPRPQVARVGGAAAWAPRTRTAWPHSTDSSALVISVFAVSFKSKSNQQNPHTEGGNRLQGARA